MSGGMNLEYFTFFEGEVKIKNKRELIDSEKQIINHLLTEYYHNNNENSLMNLIYFVSQFIVDKEILVKIKALNLYHQEMNQLKIRYDSSKAINDRLSPKDLGIDSYSPDGSKRKSELENLKSYYDIKGRFAHNSKVILTYCLNVLFKLGWDNVDFSDMKTISEDIEEALTKEPLENDTEPMH